MLPLVRGAIGLAAAPVGRALGFLTSGNRRPEADLVAREARAAALHREAMRATHDALIAAEDARRSRQEFLSRMSHELRTPLNSVIGFSRVLETNRAGNQRPEDIELLSRVRSNGERLLRLIDGVLDQAVLQAGSAAFDIEAVDVAAIVSRVAGEFAPRARRRDIRIVPVIPRDPCVARLDAGRFEQIVYHLVDNAVKFTTSGEVRVTLLTHATTGAAARLVIADTGIGIPADRLDHIFTPFGQIDASMRRAYGGAGLGLPLARQLCAAMRCSLAVESAVGCGSRFTIEFPSV
jgi:signal transduction histidine kinase